VDFGLPLFFLAGVMGSCNPGGIAVSCARKSEMLRRCVSAGFPVWCREGHFKRFHNEKGAKGMNYEYKVVYMRPPNFQSVALESWATSTLQQTINNLSAAGWEYVNSIPFDSAANAVLVFRRARS
jgi:hypothetical protein